MEKFLAPWRPQLLSIFRIVAGLLLTAHGTVKILGYPVHAMNNAVLASPTGVSGIIELIFGPLLVIGLFTRLSAFMLSGLSAAAYFYVYAAKSFHPIVNGGEAAAFYAFAFLYLAAAGGGPWSVDAAIRKNP